MLAADNRKVVSIILPLALLLAGLYLTPIRIFETDFSKIPGDYGDARLNNYFLEHGYNYFIGKTDKYWDAPFMYPHANTLSLSENLLGTLPLYVIFRIGGFDRETSFQLWLLTLFVLNFVCCYWVLYRWSGNLILSATGAYIFSFSILLTANIYNVQTYPRFIVPFVFYWSWKYLSGKQIKYFLLLSLGIVYQFYCGIYLGFLLVYTLLFLFLSYFITYRDTEIFKQFRKVKTAVYYFLTLLLAVVLLLPLLLPYIQISVEIGMRNFNEVFPTIPTLRSYFFTSSAPIIWNFLSKHAISVLENWWCHFLFIGAMPWLGILALPAVLFKQKKSVEKKFILFIFIWLFLSFIFCLNINEFSLYKFIFHLPGFASIRGVHRIINIEVFCFILIFVFVFRELSLQNKLMKKIIFLFPLLAVVDNLINPQEVKRFDKAESQKEINNIREKIKSYHNSRHRAVAFIPTEIVDHNPTELHLSVMLASQELNIPCVNAYTGYLPGNYIDFFSSMDETSLSHWCTYNKTDCGLIQKIYDEERRMKNKTQIHLMATNNKFVCADGNLNNIVVANRDSASGWETFLLMLFEYNKCAIRSYDNHFLCAELGNKNEITATRDKLGAWETFTLIEFENNYVAFKAANEKYLSVDEKTERIFANADSIGEREKFEMISK